MVEYWQMEEVLSKKKQGEVWKVASNLGRIGYFKFARCEHTYFSGPLIANEWIAAKLAERLGFPVGELQLATVIGPDGIAQSGVVSVSVKASEIVTWGKLDQKVRRNAERYVKHVDKLRMVVVFDAWITNVDRAAGRNLILYRNETGKKYYWYLIDHGLTLCGSPHKWERHKWDQPYWQKLWLFHHVSDGMQRLQSRFRQLEPMIARIEAISDAELTQLVHQAPRLFCDEAERAFMIRLLITRKAQIREIIRKWVDFKGNKEYRSRKKG